MKHHVRETIFDHDMMDRLNNLEMSADYRARVRAQMEQAERFAAFFIGTARLVRRTVSVLGVGMRSLEQSVRARIAKWVRRQQRAQVFSSDTRRKLIGE